VDAVLIRSLPFREPGRLVFLWERAPTFPEMSVAYPDYVAWRERARTLEAIGLFRSDSFNLGGVERPERVKALRATAGFFRMLGVAPALGREFTPDEDRPGGAPVALLTYELWGSRFARSEAVLGRRIQLDGVPHTIVGVLPRGFRFGLEPFTMVAPTGQIDPKQLDRGDHPGLYGVGRLAPGATLAQARSELEGIGRALGERYREDRDLLPALMPMQERLARDIRSKLLLLKLDQLPEEYILPFAHDVSVAVRTAGAPLALADAIRKAVASVDPELPVYQLRAYDAIARDSVAAERFSTALLALFAGIAVILALAGVYAVMSHAVARRTHEIGVRMALGAQPGAVQRMVVGQGLRVVAIGLALLSVLANFTFMAAYPLWSTTIIVIDILVIYALVVHGREMRSI
jgi:hypothetical protein